MDTEAAAASDTIAISATDSLGGVARPVSIAVTVNGPPSVTAPARAVVAQGVTAAIKGLAFHESGNVVGVTFTLDFAAMSGTLGATGTGVTGSGTSSLTLSGSEAQVSADLKTLTDTEAVAGSDTITISATDSFGAVAKPVSVAVTVDGPPVITAPADTTLAEGVATTIKGVALHQSGDVLGETFAVVLADTSGTLGASGTGVRGSGTRSLTLTGSEAQVNADLKTLTDTQAAPASDTITISATDSLGGAASPVSIAVTVAEVPAARPPSPSAGSIGDGPGRMPAVGLFAQSAALVGATSGAGTIHTGPVQPSWREPAMLAATGGERLHLA